MGVDLCTGLGNKPRTVEVWLIEAQRYPGMLEIFSAVYVFGIKSFGTWVSRLAQAGFR